MRPAEWERLADARPPEVAVDGGKISFHGRGQARFVAGQWVPSGGPFNRAIDTIKLNGVDHMVRVELDLAPNGEWRGQCETIIRTDLRREPTTAARRAATRIAERAVTRVALAHPEILAQADTWRRDTETAGLLRSIHERQVEVARLQAEIADLVRDLPEQVRAELDLSLEGVEIG